MGGQQLTARDGVKLELYEWLADDPRITVVLLHGYAEHCGRYEHVAKAWNARGIQMVGCDQRGHGKSEGDRGFVERFEDYHRDVDALMDAAKGRAKGTPIALYGHSIGGLIALHWLLAGNGRDLAGVLISSPFLGLAVKVSPLKLTAGKVMAKILPKLGLPSGLSGKDVCTDETFQRQYDSDPMIFKNTNARWFAETMSAVAQVHARAGELKGPMMLLYAGDDRIASADDTDRFCRGLRNDQAVTERLAKHAHEIVNEGPPVREKVIARMGDWLLARAEAKAA
jgi:alpha-beta hydrolase superfamily lysophospholipase